MGFQALLSSTYLKNFLIIAIAEHFPQTTLHTEPIVAMKTRACTLDACPARPITFVVHHAKSPSRLAIFLQCLDTHRRDGAVGVRLPIFILYGPGAAPLTFVLIRFENFVDILSSSA
jgi:hypothetical protein